MNIASHYRALDLLFKIHARVDTETKLAAVGVNATNGVANANSQILYREKLDELVEALRSADVSELLAYEHQLIEDSDFGYLVPQKLALQLEDTASAKQSTLGVIGKDFTELSVRIAKDLEKIASFTTGLEEVGLDQFDMGDAEAVFSVHYPETSYSSSLSILSTRFKETHGALSKIISLAGHDDDLEILYLSSGSALVILGGTLGAAATFALVLERLASAFEKYQGGCLNIERSRQLRVQNADAQAKLDAANEAAQEVHEYILLEEIQSISVELASDRLENPEVGITAGMKVLVEHMKKGIDYDVLAEEVDADDFEDEASLAEVQQKVQLINNRESRKNIKLIREIDRTLIRRIEARQRDDEE